MTLVEVIAGLVVLGTLLAAVTVARGRFLRQWAEADRRVQATRAADALLSEWLSGSPQAVPIRSQGPLVGGAANQIWRTQVIRDSAAAELGAIVVRLQVFEMSAPAKATVTVDFLLPSPRPATTATTQPSPAEAS
jgi:type II secretory pathway pseudopilin PulG